MNTILIIEDNALNLLLAKDLLQLAGYKVMEADCASKGIQLAKIHQPSLILLDMHLPVIYGYEAIRLIKADPEIQSIPVVAFTALALPEERQRALAYGCSGFITKPIDVETFTTTVEDFLIGSAGLATPLAPSPIQRAHHSKQEDMEGFLMRSSHELQAPIRKINHFASMIKQTTSSQLSEEDLTFLSRIEDIAGKMSELLSAMMTYARISSSEAVVEPVDLKASIEEAIHYHQATIERLKAKLTVRVSGQIMAVRAQISQLFKILLEDSLKFQAKGKSPDIVIESHFKEQTCEIRVTDNGIGFSQEHAEKIFNPFGRLHGVSSQYSGYGLGLTTAKKIVEGHQGTIKAESELGVGTTFTITLPNQVLNSVDSTASTVAAKAGSTLETL